MSRIILPAVLLWIITLASCSQAPVQYVHQVDTLYVTDTNGLKPKGTLRGSVSLMDYHLANSTPPYYVSDASGVTVRLEGITLTTTTDSAGYWAFHDLPAGIYTISFSKDSFSTYKMFYQQFVGGGELLLQQSPTLGRIPTEFSISNLRMDSTSVYEAHTYFYFRGQTSPDSLPPYVTPYLFAVRDSTTSIDPSTLPIPGSIAIDQNTGKMIREAAMSDSKLYELGFKRGDRAYIVACFGFGAYNSYASYWNPILDQRINSAIGPVRSNFVEITVP